MKQCNLHQNILFVLFLLLFTLKINAQATKTDSLNVIQTITEPLFVKIKKEKDTTFLFIFTTCSDKALNGQFELSINREKKTVIFEDCKATIPYSITDKKLILIGKGQHYSDYTLIHFKESHDPNLPPTIRYIPLWCSIVPPLVAIILALIFKEVILSLFIGIFAGALIVNGLRFDPVSIILGFYDVVTRYLVNSMNSKSHVSIIIFSLMIGGIVAVVSKNGGMAGAILKLSKYAKSAQSTAFVTWLLGIAIFFDDYANALIVGNSMRPLADKHKMSREKLSYIVDSTAAPVSAIALITTWIGVELSYIKDNMANLEGLENVPNAYSVFLISLQYSFYPILTLLFILILIFTRRDFGAMYEAERRTKANETINDVAVESKEDLSPAMGVPLRWYNGVLPIAAIIIITAIGLVITGLDNAFLLLKEKNFVGDGTYQSIWANLHRLSDAENVGFFERLGIVIGNTGSHIALLWASLTGLTLSILLTVTQKIMTLEQTMNTALTGFKTILPAMLILVLAWSVGTLTKELQTATFLASVLQDTLSPALMPVAIFILAGAIAFATGSSWSTMAILYPIAIPATWAICMANGMEQAEALPILYNVIATVLAAAVFGDHCSPISDTTILSSLATNCNHIDHVRTQMPYALVVGLVSVFMGWFAAAFAFHLVVNFAIGIALLWGVIRVFGKKIE